jgi:hypothetical protein
MYTRCLQSHVALTTMSPRGGYEDDSHTPQSMRELREWWQRAQLDDALCSGACWVRPADRFRAGSIAQAKDFWHDVLLGEDWPLPLSLRRCDMLRWITEGVNVYDFMKPFTGRFEGTAYDSAVPPAYFKRTHVQDAVSRAFMMSEIASLEAKGCIKRVETKPRVVMPLHVVQKSSGENRLCYNARFLNQWLAAPSFEMDNLREFQRGLEQDDDIIVMDFKSAYHSVAMHQASETWLGFALDIDGETVYFVWRVLPFGLNIAPWVFSRLSTTLTAWLRQVLGLHCLIYLDDLAIRIRRTLSRQQAARVRWRVIGAVYLAGFVLALNKGTLTPATRVIILGMGIDTCLTQYFVPEEKWQRIEAELSQVAQRPTGSTMSLKSAQSIAGKLHAIQLAVPCVSLYLGSMHTAIATALRRGTYYVTLTSATQSDLRTLLQLREWGRMSRWQPELHMRIRVDTDSTLNAWGGAAFIPGRTEAVTMSGAFTTEEEDTNVAVQEARAVVLTLMHEELAAVMHDIQIDLFVDNEATRWSLARLRSRQPSIRTLLQTLCAWQCRNNITIKVARVSTEDNALADALSRGGSTVIAATRSELRLSETLFVTVQAWAQNWAQTETSVDVCASRTTAKLFQFINDPAMPDIISPTGDSAVGYHHMRVASNVFTQTFGFTDANSTMLYAFPPRTLVGAVWRHMRLCKTRGIMVAICDSTEMWAAHIPQEARGWGVLAPTGASDALTLRQADGEVPYTLPAPLIAYYFNFTE